MILAVFVDERGVGLSSATFEAVFVLGVGGSQII